MKPFFRTLPSVKRLQVTSMMGNLSIIGKKKKKKKNKKKYSSTTQRTM